jgi:hypothetical protein
MQNCKVCLIVDLTVNPVNSGETHDNKTAQLTYFVTKQGDQNLRLSCSQKDFHLTASKAVEY